MHPTNKGTTATWGIFEVPKKTMFIRLRWLVIITCSYLLLLSQPSAPSAPLVVVFVCLYILSNVGLGLVGERRFESPYFYAPIVLIDTFCITASLMMSRQIGGDFYLAYFLIILLCATLQDFYGSTTVAVLVSIVYGYLLLDTTETYDSSSLLRLPFLFVVSLFYGYFAQIARAETARRQTAEEGRRAAQLRAEMERSKSEFMTTAAHELRTPLTAVIGYSQLLTDGCFGPLTGEQKDAANRLLESASTLRSLVEDIHRYSGLENRESALELSRDDCSELLRELRSEMAPLEQHRPYRIRYEVEEKLPRVETDWKKLKTVLAHLLGNAVKFTERGTVKFTVRANRLAGELSFEVADTGIGIPQKDIPLIFEGFRQLDGSITRRYGGTGIGLAICKGFVELLEGRIDVESEPGKGTTFTVTVPERAEPKTQPSGFPKPVPHPSIA